MGMLYEKMGQSEKAAAAYERFAEAWEEADAALQPRVKKTRRRIDVLTGQHFVQVGSGFA